MVALLYLAAAHKERECPISHMIISIGMVSLPRRSHIPPQQSG